MVKADEQREHDGIDYKGENSMLRRTTVKIRYPAIGICGLSCRLCPRYHTKGESKCGGCKSRLRMTVGCPFITCAVKRKAIEFCWDCQENRTCIRWNAHREFGKKHDTFVCYQKLEDDILFVQKNGIGKFEKLQKIREKLLKEMLLEFNEGRSKNYYCIAVSMLEIDGVKKALSEAIQRTKGLRVEEKSRVLHSILDDAVKAKHFGIRLRK